MIGVGVVGLGFMGRTHVRAYRRAAEAGGGQGGSGLCRVVAVATADPGDLAGSARGNLETGGDGPLLDADATVYGSADELAGDDRIGAVSICTPTDTHVELAAMFLRAGKHVLVEKPVALRTEDVRGLARVAEKCGRICMPAMCMRYWPGWDWLKDRVSDGSLGAVRAATFTRLGSRPVWSPEFYQDNARCGGAAFDLHVHDVDIISWLFGRPSAVTSTGDLDHILTQYEFDDGPGLVTAEGGWVGAAGFPFRMRYTVEFENAVADWDLTRPPSQPQLMLTRHGRCEPVPLPPGAGYEGEVAAFLRAVQHVETRGIPTLAEALEVTRVLEAECRSLREHQRAAV